MIGVQTEAIPTLTKAVAMMIDDGMTNKCDPSPLLGFLKLRHYLI
jgi:hypothetical protein